jgi:ribosome biogenesis GTPase
MLLAVNKCDLLDPANEHVELEKLEPYREIIHITRCSTSNGEGIEDLRALLAGQTCAFVGHSGVGKSSLINAIAPSLRLETGDVSQGYGRGTHTTTSSTLHRLPGDTKLIDTPGVRSFGLWDIDPKSLAWYFPEFEEFIGECKFRDCSHNHEPACGVKTAAQSGCVSKQRYETYLRILTSL